MSVARLHYEQTADERYDERTNTMIRNMLEGMLLKINWEEGGTGFSDDPAALVAENEFEVTAKREHIKFAHRVLQKHLGRPVTLTWINPWYRVRTYLRWHLKTKWQVWWIHRGKTPIAPAGFEDLPEDDFDWPENFYELSNEEQAQVIKNYDEQQGKDSLDGFPPEGDPPQHGPWPHHD